MRVDKMNKEELYRQACHIAAALPGEEPAGVLLCMAEALRDIVDDRGQRAICLFDDPTETNVAHATSLRSDDQDELAIKELRGKLLDYFSGIIRIDSVYEHEIKS